MTSSVGMIIHSIPNWMESHNPAMFQTTNQQVLTQQHGICLICPYSIYFYESIPIFTNISIYSRMTIPPTSKVMVIFTNLRGIGFFCRVADQEIQLGNRDEDPGRAHHAHQPPGSTGALQPPWRPLKKPVGRWWIGVNIADLYKTWLKYGFILMKTMVNMMNNHDLTICFNIFHQTHGDKLGWK